MPRENRRCPVNGKALFVLDLGAVAVNGGSLPIITRRISNGNVLVTVEISPQHHRAWSLLLELLTVVHFVRSFQVMWRVYNHRATLLVLVSSSADE